MKLINNNENNTNNNNKAAVMHLGLSAACFCSLSLFALVLLSFFCYVRLFISFVSCFLFCFKHIVYTNDMSYVFVLVLCCYVVTVVRLLSFVCYVVMFVLVLCCYVCIISIMLLCMYY